MLALALILAATLADDGAGPLQILSETGCPTVAAVRAQLQPLTPQRWPPEATGKSVALAEAADRGLVVTLRGPADESLEVRRLPLYSGCDERARAVAVVIASWLTALPEAAPPTVGLALPPPVTIARAAAAPSPSGAIAVGLSAAGLASLASDGLAGLAPGVMLEAAAGPRAARWSLSLAGFLEGTHRTEVGAGEATWWRWGGAAGGAWQVARRGRLWLDLRGALLVSRVHIAGAGFSDNAGGTTWDVGGALGTRLGLALPRLQPWLGAWAVGWGGTQAVHVAGDAARGQLPRWQGFFGLGATFGARGETF